MLIAPQGSLEIFGIRARQLEMEPLCSAGCEATRSQLLGSVSSSFAIIQRGTVDNSVNGGRHGRHRVSFVLTVKGISTSRKPAFISDIEALLV